MGAFTVAVFVFDGDDFVVGFDDHVYFAGEFEGFGVDGDVEVALAGGEAVVFEVAALFLVFDFFVGEAAFFHFVGGGVDVGQDGLVVEDAGAIDKFFEFINAEGEGEFVHGKCGWVIG